MSDNPAADYLYAQAVITHNAFVKKSAELDEARQTAALIIAGKDAEIARLKENCGE